MATGDYLTVAQLRARLGIEASDPSEDARLAEVVASASRTVNGWCGTRFTQDAAVSARTFTATNLVRLSLGPGHPISALTGLIVATDEDANGTYETVWTADDWTAPESYGVDGALAAYTRIIARRGGRTWPISGDEPLVQITARWGWPAVPSPVVEAASLIAAEIWKLKDAPLGGAGFGSFGADTVQAIPMVANLLTPFAHGARLVGIG